MTESIAVVGLGYVGLPAAVALARAHPGTLGFDIDPTRVAELEQGEDRRREVPPEALAAVSLSFSSDPAALTGRSFFVVAVPTPVTPERRPDLGALAAATETVGRAMGPGAVVVYESTVYPGVTEEYCGPILERTSGLKAGVDFGLAYSPERINPGDQAHGFEGVIKIVSAADPRALDRVRAVYEPIVRAGLHLAPSIKVAEMAKVIENTQRDLNIALMNELAIICDRMGIRTSEVLAAAGTKWNFLRFRPGLVGGHCIGVDPYYLTAKAESLGYFPEVMLAGRRMNDRMGIHVAQRLCSLLVASGIDVAGTRVAVLGVTYKENVRDMRNSRVPELIAELKRAGVEPLLHDPMADPAMVRALFGMELTDWAELRDVRAVVLAVPHREYLERGGPALAGLLDGAGGVLVDVCSATDPAALPEGVTYWSL